MGPTTTINRNRLTRDDWLAAALEVLHGEGIHEVSIVRLARDLGVTSGSFYWHFQDRKELLQGLLDFWVQSQTEIIIAEVESAGGAADERLLRLMQVLTTGEQARYDVAVRAWANFNKMAAKVVREMDERRVKYLRPIFREMGFEGDEAELRVRLFYYYQLAEPNILYREPKNKRKRMIELRHRLLTQR